MRLENRLRAIESELETPPNSDTDEDTGIRFVDSLMEGMSQDVVDIRRDGRLIRGEAVRGVYFALLDRCLEGDDFAGRFADGLASFPARLEEIAVTALKDSDSEGQSRKRVHDGDPHAGKLIDEAKVWSMFEQGFLRRGTTMLADLREAF